MSDCVFKKPGCFYCADMNFAIWFLGEDERWEELRTRRFSPDLEAIEWVQVESFTARSRHWLSRCCHKLCSHLHACARPPVSRPSSTPVRCASVGVCLLKEGEKKKRTKTSHLLCKTNLGLLFKDIERSWFVCIKKKNKNHIHTPPSPRPQSMKRWITTLTRPACVHGSVRSQGSAAVFAAAVRRCECHSFDLLATH